MTAKELFRANADNIGYQLDKVFEGISGSQWDAKATPQGMSASEILDHLADCYTAMKKSLAGQEHDWGSTDLGTSDPNEKLTKAMALRAEAIAGVEAADDEKLNDGFGYITAHDAYHVGQMCLVRLSLDPEWDAYSIYQM